MNIFLLTGFKPFHGLKENTSELVLNSLDKVNNLSINKKILPVSKKSIEYFNLMKTTYNFKDYKKNFIFLHFGVSMDILKYKFELLAINDYQGEKINKSFNDYEETKINLLYLKKNLNVKVSMDSGNYICNYLYFHSLNFTRRTPNMYSLFIHLPHHDIISVKKQVFFVKKLIKRINKYFIKYKSTESFLKMLTKKFFNGEKKFKVDLANSIKDHGVVCIKCTKYDKVLIQKNFKEYIPEMLTRFSYIISKNILNLENLKFVIEDRQLFFEWKTPFNFEYQGLWRNKKSIYMVLENQELYQGEHIINNITLSSITLELKDGVNLVLFLIPKNEEEIEDLEFEVLDNKVLETILNEQKKKNFKQVGIPKFKWLFSDMSDNLHKLYFNIFGIYDTKLITKPKNKKKSDFLISKRFICILIHKPIFNIIVYGTVLDITNPWKRWSQRQAIFARINKLKKRLKRGSAKFKRRIKRQIYYYKRMIPRWDRHSRKKYGKHWKKKLK